MIHIWSFLDHHTRHTLNWKDFSEPREKVFSMIKTAARLEGVNLLLFDGRIYRYDSGQGKFIRTEWDSIDWEDE